MEAVRIFPIEELGHSQMDVNVAMVAEDLKSTLEGLMRFLYGQDLQIRWIPAYFPFTEPSFEMEIYFKGDWLEMLGCGVIHTGVMENSKRDPIKEIGWAAGLGLERFAMQMFDIPDIRLFWSKDERFLSQFKAGEITQFKPFSKYPSCWKDVAFWLPAESVEAFAENDLYQVIRDVGGDLIERVECVDIFTDKKKNKTSRCYRIHYRSLERTLLNEEIDTLQFRIREDMKNKLPLELRQEHIHRPLRCFPTTTSIHGSRLTLQKFKQNVQC
eukprot:TRINITY_DN8081_c0_g1_i2.p1 TRINITY_DN8081_c0_g1~~TRINITY_DN8081_c0_g1_i2.p1  ORF type:complete len:271 (-),score=26.44 TRINITY_DN8081_c0_g1_i2:183-995(-)